MKRNSKFSFFTTQKYLIYAKHGLHRFVFFITATSVVFLILTSCTPKIGFDFEVERAWITYCTQDNPLKSIDIDEAKLQGGVCIAWTEVGRNSVRSLDIYIYNDKDPVNAIFNYNIPDAQTENELSSRYSIPITSELETGSYKVEFVVNGRPYSSSDFSFEVKNKNWLPTPISDSLAVVIEDTTCYVLDNRGNSPRVKQVYLKQDEVVRAVGQDMSGNWILVRLDDLTTCSVENHLLVYQGPILPLLKDVFPPSLPLPVTLTPIDPTLIPPKVTIANLHDGQLVNCLNEISGTYLPDLEEYIWAVVYVGGRFYPQDNGGKAAQKVGGKWYQTVRFGNCNDTSGATVGVRFTLFIFTADESANNEFEAYLTSAAASENWEGMLALPSGTHLQVSISVIRK